MVLFQAFASLVLERPYDDIKINHIIGKAGISRSTFYQHYKNKDDILADSMSGMFGTLADTACGNGEAAHLLSILEHFWENRNFGRAILNGPAYRRLVQELSKMIESRLENSPDAPAQPALRLKAIQQAEGQLAIIRAWLSGTVTCDTRDLVTHLTS
mgnify:CR=1 FL=1